VRCEMLFFVAACRGRKTYLEEFIFDMQIRTVGINIELHDFFQQGNPVYCLLP
jgi:hypothetical protein